jgi:hypothetical protein
MISWNSSMNDAHTSYRGPIFIFWDVRGGFVVSIFSSLRDCPHPPFKSPLIERSVGRNAGPMHPGGRYTHTLFGCERRRSTVPAGRHGDKMELPMTWNPPTIFPFILCWRKRVASFLSLPIVFLFVFFCVCASPLYVRRSIPRVRLLSLLVPEQRHIRMWSRTKDTETRSNGIV